MQQANHVRESIVTMNEISDDREGTWLQSEIRFRYLLEGAVMARMHGRRMVSMRSALSYPGMAAHIIRPMTLRVFDLVGKGNLGFDGESLQGWNVYKEKFANPVRASQRRKHAERHARAQPLYVRMRDGRVQTGKPFDIFTKGCIDQDVEYVKAEKLSQYAYRPSRKIRLISDPMDGMIFYCPRRHVFSSAEKIDVSFYESTTLPPKKMRDAFINVNQDLPVTTQDAREAAKNKGRSQAPQSGRLAQVLDYQQELEPMFNVWKPEVTPLRKLPPPPQPETPRDVRARWEVLDKASAADNADGKDDIHASLSDTIPWLQLDFP